MSTPNISSIFSDFTNAVVATNTIVPKLKQELENLESICSAAEGKGPIDFSPGVFNKDGCPDGNDLINDYLSLIGTLNPAAGTPEAAQLAALQKCPAFASIYQSATAAATTIGNFGSGSEYFSYYYGTQVNGLSLDALAKNYTNDDYTIPIGQGSITYSTGGEPAAQYLVNYSDFTINGADFKGTADSLAAIIAQF